ncbi:MAG: DNA primase [Pseudomonadota bacterium]
MIPQSFIQDLLNRVDIVDVVERYVPLKRAGANYVACCPFHNEKSPSFTVSQSKQFYHCFGCGAHGSVIGFVMEYSGISFVEAVKELASGAGIVVPEEKRDGGAEPRKVPPSTDLYEMMQRAAQYYKGELKRSETAIAYLKRRGLSGEIAARFGLGYAPDGWQNLEAVFPAEYAGQSMLDTGLVIENEQGRRYDRFRGRAMFPIHNAKGLIIGFGGRVLDQGEPKYLNSPETPLFEKGRELYGLFQARRAIRDVGRVLVVEGYMDVVALAQYGVEYAVATLGTATTPFHVQKLLRQADEVVFCFDGDDAGRRAAWRALENSLAQLVDGKQLSFLFLPQGEDPDSLVRKIGKEAFEAQLKDALPLSAFLLRELIQRVNLQTQEGRARLLQDARLLVTQIAAPALGLMLRKRLAELAGVSQEELEAMYQIRSESAKPKVPPKAARAQPSVVRKLSEMLLYRPDLAGTVDTTCLEEAEGLALAGVNAEEIALLREMLEFLCAHAHIQSSAAVLEGFRECPGAARLQHLAGGLFAWEERQLDEAALAQEFDGAWQRFQELIRNAHIHRLHAKLQHEGWDEADKARYRELQRRATASPKNQENKENRV